MIVSVGPSGDTAIEEGVGIGEIVMPMDGHAHLNQDPAASLA
jgi:hypothetical protein